MLLSKNLIATSLFVIASSFVNAATVTTPFTTVNSQDDFCLFLPPKPGLVVAVNEDNGIAFCTKKNLVSKASLFPTGFITTAHYLKSSTYVQVTGFFDRSKYSLGITDGGGQYDSHAHHKPTGAMCKGYNFFVSIIEPDIERFCIRCCQDTADCNTGRSGYGCLRVISGDYTNDNNFGTTNTTKTSKHSNTSVNSVLSDLNELPSTDDSTTTTADDSTDADSTDADSTDDSTDATATTDATDATTTDATTTDVDEATPTDDTTANAGDEIASEVETLQANLTSSTVEEIEASWTTFATKLSGDYPQVSTQIQQLSAVTTGFTTTSQWSTFFALLTENVAGLTEVATATTTPGSTATHTDSQDDLDWLFEHRNSHNNQATW